MKLTEIADRLAARLSSLTFDLPITHVYHPLIYARRTHHDYLARYGGGRGGVVLVGMNPGPWGMAQTGIPFGEINYVRDWLKIEGRVAKPAREHPLRPVEGFACRRSEVSGARLWGWAQATFDTPARFFRQFLVANYCPLMFLESSGRNRTPDKLPAGEREPLLGACDEALQQTIRELNPRFVIGVGAFAASRVLSALSDPALTTGRILHPSPASPAANRGWSQAITRELRRLGVALPAGAGGRVGAHRCR